MWNWAQCGQRRQTRTLGLYLSAWSISTLPACKLTRHIGVAAAGAAAASAVRWMRLIVTHCLRMNCHLATAVIQCVRGLGLYLTAHALTVRDHGFTAVCTLRMMIIWLHCSLTYLLLLKWSGRKFWFQSKQPLPFKSRNICLMITFKADFVPSTHSNYYLITKMPHLM